MKKNNFKGCMILAVTAFIWGTAFIAQRTGMEFIEPFTFSFCRSLLGVAVLFPISIIFGGKKGRELPLLGYGSKKLVKAGIISGIFLFAANSFQQIGIYQGTTSGKAAFITSLYIIFAPIFGMALGKKAGINVWIGVAVGSAGMYLLCLAGENGIGKGDFITFFCSMFFAMQILVIDRFSPEVDCIKMSCIEFFVCTLLSLPMMFVFESPSFAEIKTCAFPLIYTGVISGAGAYTLQIIGQKYADVTPATLTMSLESVFAAVAAAIIPESWGIRRESMTPPELVGCVLIFAAITVSQLDIRGLIFKKKANRAE